jgi:cysteine-rich repeat protein
MGQYECDDGNTIDGDGCDHNCMKEKGFLCTNGGIKDTCILPSYKIEYIEGMYKMRMVFNYAVENITSYLDKMKARIKRENGTTTQLNFLSSKVINDSSIEMELDLSDVEADGNEKLEFDMVSLLKHIGDNSSLNTTLLTIPALPIKKVVASKVGVAAPLACFGVAAIGGVVGAIFAKGICNIIN